MKKRLVLGLNSMLLILISMVLLSCTNLSQIGMNSSGQDVSDVNSKLENLSGGGNGGSYDGKLVYLSRQKDLCQGQSLPNRKIIQHPSSNQWSLEKLDIQSDQCEYRSMDVFGAFGFQESQLASYLGELYDMQLPSSVQTLPNENVVGVCRIKDASQPIRVGDSLFYGFVLNWNSVMNAYSTRLDYNWMIEGNKTLSFGPYVLKQKKSDQIIYSSSLYDQQQSLLFNEPIWAHTQRQQLELNLDTNLLWNGSSEIFQAEFLYSFIVYRNQPPYVIPHTNMLCFFVK